MWRQLISMYFSSEGRLPRGRFVFYFLLLFFASSAFWTLWNLRINSDKLHFWELHQVEAAFILAFFAMFYCLGAKRLQDSGRDGRWLVPVILVTASSAIAGNREAEWGPLVLANALASLTLLGLFLHGGSADVNRFGPPPVPREKAAPTKLEPPLERRFEGGL